MKANVTIRVTLLGTGNTVPLAVEEARQRVAEALLGIGWCELDVPQVNFTRED